VPSGEAKTGNDRNRYMPNGRPVTREKWIAGFKQCENCLPDGLGKLRPGHDQPV